ncbi:MAG: hypothetical protein KDK34_11845 [Leptospiraceae bacterium]|nr:hypothetical protein [Leptospiraceae bacterium]
MVKKVSVLVLLASLLVGGLLSLSAQEGGSSDEICFLPVDKEIERCVNFKTKWYIPVELTTGVVIYLREVNTDAASHIWNSGQILVNREEWDKIKQALASQGLGSVCPPPEYRHPEDFLKARAEVCKN